MLQQRVVIGMEIADLGKIYTGEVHTQFYRIL